MRFFTVHIKDPDGFDHALYECDLSEEDRAFMRKFVHGDECIDILFDTKTGVARLLERSE